MSDDPDPIDADSPCPSNRGEGGIVVVCDDNAWDALAGGRDLVEHAARACVTAVAPGRDNAELAILLTNDNRMAGLNAQFRGKDTSTNVLSFPADAAPYLGDIALAYETVAREAVRDDISLADHVRHLVIHGVLHLFGYDHQTGTGADAMEAFEIEILAGLCVANPYARPLDARAQESEPSEQ